MKNYTLIFNDVQIERLIDDLWFASGVRVDEWVTEGLITHIEKQVKEQDEAKNS